MARSLNQEDLIRREQARRESTAELNRLKQRWPELRRTMSAEAVTLAWFLYGDRLWVESELTHAKIK